VPFYRPGDDDAIDEVIEAVLGPVGQSDGSGPPAGMLAVPVVGLIDTGRGRGGGALVAGGGARPGRGEVAVFCQPAACGKASPRATAVTLILQRRVHDH
jgi:hypothetical protein